MLDVAEWGENESGVPLCANCHELFHIVDRAFSDLQTDKESNSRSVRAWCAVIDAWGKDHPTLERIYELVNLSRRERNRQHTERSMHVFEYFFGGVNADTDQ